MNKDIKVGGPVICPHCYGDDAVRNGVVKGGQFYRCRGEGCGRQFIGVTVQVLVERAVAKKVRLVAQKLLRSGVAATKISRATGVARSTIYSDRDSKKINFR